MNRKYLVTGLLALVLAVSTGCGQKPAAAPSEPNTQSSGEVEAPETVNKEEPPNENNENEQPTESTGGTQGEPAEKQNTGTQGSPAGNKETASQEKKATIELYYTDPELLDLIKASREITYTDEENKYVKAFEGLQNSGDDQLVPLWRDSIKLTSVKFDQGALTLDIVKPDEANLGSGGESYAIEALRNTFFQFEEVKSIQLLVDGKKVESLMGHVDLENPMTRN
ncbi:Sporulation and spore germination [Paenibacillus uliginis N3/975]|uniref:Sporulation and spore germination n=1 Tax=Paenibacillus uliginis N3/975 TaxID=1313296 RepID=A0A1X7HJV6_9BACL|nr:GerMN domain-containing protein [Paenibacillus uliginis]SMF87165.1 Sporulation and spore germination [Paenibacillus uliginis N3/975]